MRRAVRVCGRLLVVAGVVALAITLGQWWLGNVHAEHTQSATVHRLEREFAHNDVVGTTHLSAIAQHDGSASSSGESTAKSSSTVNGAYALIRIPRFGKNFVRPIVQGTGTQQLKEGVGHYDGTAEPGQVGNFAVAGHRTTYGEPFHQIAELRAGDLIIVRTRTHTFTYRVVSHQIVSPSDVQVIASDPPGVAPGRLMTLTSCHPMYFATQRYVVHARLVSTT